MPACHASFDVRDPSQVGEARRAAVQRAEALGFDTVASGRVALVATELGNNLVRHAQGGRLLVGEVDTGDGGGVIEILSLDSGPGLSDLDACLEDGYSTAGTPGTGLGAVRRLSSEFDAFSVPAAGTVILARIAARAGDGRTAKATPSSSFDIGAVALAAPGETICGDAWSTVGSGRLLSLLVADGLGHGPGAHEAAAAAVSEFASEGGAGPSEAIGRIHAALRSTRGAAVAVARLDGDKGEIVFAGAGNISGRLISGIGDRTLISQHGTAGVQMRNIRDVSYPWPEHTLLVMHSDGLKTRWTFETAAGLMLCHPTLVAAWLIRDHTRGPDDVTVVVLRRSGR